MRVLILFLLSLLVSCGYDEFPQWQGSDVSDKLANTTMASLSALVDDQPMMLASDYVFSGVVVSSTSAGNFYKSVFIDDGSGAIELKLGLYELDNIYPVGTKVVVSAKGLYAMKSQGVTQLGLNAGSSIGYMSHKYIISSYVEISEYDVPVLPLSLSVSDLSEIYCGQLIKLCNIYYNQADDYETWASYSSWTGYYSDSYRTFEDTSGATVSVLTSGYADFVSDQVPMGEIDICGVLFYDDSKGYYMKIRDLSDLTLRY